MADPLRLRYRVTTRASLERAWDAIADKVREGDFYRREHRLIFSAVRTLAEEQQPFDVVTLAESLERSGELEDAGGLRYLGIIANDTPSAANVKAYAKIVRDRSVLRQLISVGTDITDIAFKDVGTANGGAGAHSGGRIRFGPDGFLYVTTGDNHDGPLPQHPTRLGGKVLRLNTNGDPAPSNSPPNGFDARVYTYGHRNVQGITFHPTTGQAWVAEHGPNHSDEVTALVNGGNAGWDPQNRPALSCPDGYCGYAGNATTMPMTDLTRFPNAMPPAWTNNGASQGMGPATFLTGDPWGAWNGRLAVGIMGGPRLVLRTGTESGTATAAEHLSVQSARYRALVQGPDGSLYVATDAGQIWRVTPTLPN